MPVPTIISLLTAGPISEVRLADVDGDGRDELVVASRDQVEGPSAVTLEVARLDGTSLSTASHRLPASAQWWDAGHGLWTVDARGLRRLGGSSVLDRTTSLPLGPGTPAQATLVTDLDGDDQAELLLWTRASVVVLSEDGRVWGEVPATPQAVLQARGVSGGQVLATTLLPPPVVAADVDGDGDRDLLVIQRDHITVHAISTGHVGAASTWPLPAVLAASSADSAAPDSAAADVHWDDLDHDGRADLLVHRVRSDGRLAGTEAEIHFLRGTGRGLGPAQILSARAGSQHAFPVDIDGDGDLDVLVPRISLDVGNLAQAVLTKRVDVSLVVHPMSDGHLGEAIELHEITLPLEGGDAAWCMFGDHDGDGLVDLATAVGGELRIHPGAGLSVARRPSITLPLDLAVANLWARDLNGDGVDELIGWSPGQTRLVVVRLR